MLNHADLSSFGKKNKNNDSYKKSLSLTGKYRDVIMVGLVQCVVYDALFIRKAFEYIHTHLHHKP